MDDDAGHRIVMAFVLLGLLLGIGFLNCLIAWGYIDNWFGSYRG